jgi:glycerol-3-phosphate acyltransferase PlsY
VSAGVYGLAAGFAAGSVPFAWLLHKAATERDLRGEGSGNPGATNLRRVSGTAWGVAGLVLDAGKGAAAVALAGQLAGEAASVPAAVGAVLGHMYTPWLSGRGGKGVAPAAGAFAVLAPAATAVAGAAFALVVIATRYVSLGSVVAAATLPLAVMLVGPGGSHAAACAAIGLLIAWRHRENFARMRAGTEPRVGRGGGR